MSQSFPIDPNSDRVAGPYTASAGQTSFTYDFPVLDAADLLVETAPAATPDLWTAATLDADYTLSPVPPVDEGGAVVFAGGLVVGTRVRAFGAAVIGNTQDVVPAGKVDSSLLNRFFDRVTIWGLELRRDIDSANGKLDESSIGWTPVFALVADGARFVVKVVDWTGGLGEKPAVNLYVGPSGFTADIASAVNVRGATGAQGAPGADGADGADGAPGSPGADGADGADGQNGNRWFAGIAVPSNGIGLDGDMYLRTSNGDVYRKDAGTWTLLLNIKGPAGAGTGDMLAAIYDPSGVAADAFDRENHYGALPQGAVDNLVPDLAAKAPLANPALTGAPTAPTATPGNNTTQIATTAFVTAAAAAKETAGEIGGINAQTGTSYTLVLADKGKLVTMNNGSANTLTVPPNSSQAFPVNSRIDGAQIGAGQTAIAAGAGVTINSAGGLLKARAQYSGFSLVKTASNTWLLFGDLSA